MVNADDAESSRIGPVLYWLRWLGALPAALVAVLAVSFPIHWAVLILSNTSKGEDGDLSLWDLPPETLERLGQAFFAPMAFIYIGARIAPAFRKRTVGALMILWAMGLGAALTYAAMIDAYHGWAWAEFAAVGILGVLGLVSGGYGVYSVHHE